MVNLFYLCLVLLILFNVSFVNAVEKGKKIDFHYVSDNVIYMLYNNELYTSFDSGKSFEKIFDEKSFSDKMKQKYPELKHLNIINVFYSNEPGVIYVSNKKHVFRTKNYGKDWELILGLTKDETSLLPRIEHVAFWSHDKKDMLYIDTRQPKGGKVLFVMDGQNDEDLFKIIDNTKKPFELKFTSIHNIDTFYSNILVDCPDKKYRQDYALCLLYYTIDNVDIKYNYQYITNRQEIKRYFNNDFWAILRVLALTDDYVIFGSNIYDSYILYNFKSKIFSTLNLKRKFDRNKKVNIVATDNMIIVDNTYISIDMGKNFKYLPDYHCIISRGIKKEILCTEKHFSGEIKNIPLYKFNMQTQELEKLNKNL